MTLAADLIALVGAEKVRAAEAVDLLHPGLDPRNLAARLVVSPTTVHDVQQIVALARDKGVSLVPHGGRTGLAGGAVSQAGQIIVSLQNLNRIVNVDAAAGIAIVEAGVVLEKLDDVLLPHGLSMGVDLGARGSATIGGMISTNAGGIEAFRNGVMRSRVLGLEAVLADGTLVTDMAQVTKNNEGYDVKQLLIGAEGTLGIVTRAVLKLASRPSQRATALVTTETAAAANALFRQMAGAGLLAFELMTGRYFRLAASDSGASELLTFAAQAAYVFIVEIDGTEDQLVDALGQGEVLDAIIAKSDAERSAFWMLREDSWVVDRHSAHSLWYDVSVPLSSIDSFLADLEDKLRLIDYDAGLYAIGHLGDGNLHLTIGSANPLQPVAAKVTAAVYGDLKSIGGSISAEHGIGLEKRESLAKLVDPGKLAVMKLVKQALDPRAIMNPGKVL